MIFEIVCYVGPEVHHLRVVASCKDSAKEKVMRAFSGSVYKVRLS